MSQRLPDWLGRWLGADLPGEGDGAAWQLQTAWHWAPWVTVLFVLLAVAWVVYFYSRESSSAGRAYRGLLAALRLGLIAVLLFMLAELVMTLNRTGPPAMVLIVDRSASMHIADQNYDSQAADRIGQRLAAAGLDEATRLNLAKLLATENDAQLLRRLAGDYQLKVYFVGEGVERQAGTVEELVPAVDELGQTASGTQATRLGDAIRQSLRDLPGGPPAAVILLTDGVNTEGTSLADAAALARRRGVPIFAVGIGSDQPARDVQLADVLVDDVAFVDDLLSFQATVTSSGLGGEAVRVVLRRADDPTILASETLTLADDGRPQEVRLTHRPTEPGEVDYVVEVEPRDDESDNENNRQRHAVSVRDEKIRVLMAFGYPSYEFRYLKTLLDRDRSVELSSYLQEADADYVEQEETAIRTFPVARDALLEYDVVLLGDVNPRLLPRSVWRNLQALVEEKGGGVAFVAGPRYLPWLYRDVPEVGVLMPVELDEMQTLGGVGVPGFTPQPTPLGLRTASFQLGSSPEASRTIWQNLPPVYWIAEAGRIKPAALVLAEHPSRTGPDGRNLPAIVLQYVGNGRVLFHAIDATWRWRFRVGDVFFARYWVQTVRLLARSKLAGRGGAELVVDRREYRVGEPVGVRARFFDQRLAPMGEDGVTLLVESPDGRRERVTLDRNPTAPGVFEGTLGRLARGGYRVLMVDPALEGEPPAAGFRVVAPPGELAELKMDRAALIAAADATHGKFYTFAEAGTLLAELPAGRPVPIESLPAVPIWNQPWVLAVLLVLLISEWLLRRRVGML